jgi:hypothetical protein
LSAKEKLNLLGHGATHKDYRHRLPALYAVKDLDSEEFIRLLLAALEGCPEDVPGPYWTCPEGQLGALVMRCDDPRVWKTLEKVARRSAVGLRMELLDHAIDPRDTRHRPQQLRLLAGFLDDAALKDVSSGSKFEGPGAGFPYNKIEVRDFAVWEIAGLVGMPVEVKLDRTPEEWATIRKAVREALEKEWGKIKDPPGKRDKRP